MGFISIPGGSPSPRGWKENCTHKGSRSESTVLWILIIQKLCIIECSLLLKYTLFQIGSLALWEYVLKDLVAPYLCSILHPDQYFIGWASFIIMEYFFSWWLVSSHIFYHWFSLPQPALYIAPSTVRRTCLMFNVYLPHWFNNSK